MLGVTGHNQPPLLSRSIYTYTSRYRARHSTWIAWRLPRCLLRIGFSETIHPMKVLSGCGDPDDIILGHHYRQGNVKSSLSARQCHLLDWGKLFSRIGPYLYIYLVNLCQYPECKPRFFLFGDRFHDFLEWGTIH